MMDLAQRMAVVKEARKLLDVKFEHAGRTVHGLDCIGLLIVASRAAGLQVYDNPTYSPIVDANYLGVELEKAAEPMPPDEPLRIADVLLFRIGTSPQHVGMVTEINNGVVYMIHAYQTIGRVVEHEVDRAWWHRYVRAYSWRAA